MVWWVVVWVTVGMPPNSFTCIHEKITCLGIANGCPMEASIFIMFNMCVFVFAHMHVHAYVHVCGGAPTHPTTYPQQMRTFKISKTSISLELIKIT